MYYGTTYAHSAGMSVVAILIVIAFIAAIIVAVLGYKKYVTGPDEARINIKDQATWGPFLRFDSLLIDKIVKALYLFNALFIAFAYVAVVIGSIYDGFGAFLGTLIFGFLALVVVELLVRVFHESIMLSVIVARNTSDIKRMMGGPQAGSDVLPPMPVAPQPGPAPYVPTPAPAPTYSDRPYPMTYDAPSTSPFAPVAPVAPVAPAAPAAPEAPAEPEVLLAPEAPIEPEAPADDVEVIETVAEAVPEPEPAAPAPVVPAPEQPATRTCPNCGAVVSPTAHFCIVCGTKLD